MPKHHRSAPNGRLWASLIFLLPLPTFFLIAVFTRTLSLDQVGAIVAHPAALVGIAALAAVALVLVGLGYRPFVTRADHLSPGEVTALQANIIQFPKLVLAGGLVFGAAFPFVAFFAVPDLGVPPLDFFLLGYSNAIFFSMPCYIVFLQVFEESNRDVPFSEEHVSMSLTLRFSLVLGFVLTSILSVLLVAFKNVLTGGVDGDAWNPILGVGLPIGLIGLVGGLLNSVLLVRGIIRRLNTAKAFVLDLAGGDLSKPALETTSRDELGALGAYLNLVQRNLGELLGSTLGSVQKTVTIKDELVGICQTTNQEIGQMGSQVARVDAQAQEITEAVAHALGRVSNLRTGLEELNRESTQQAAMVQETSASLAQMTSAVETLAQTGASRRDSAQALETQTAEGQSELQATLEQLRQIAASVEDIRNITGVIQGIAAQTNLLSMNAAIEAAHAGQAGAGFAVVASEIRKLAETSSRNSKDITAKVKTIVLKIDQAVQAGTTTSATFESIHHEMVEFLSFFRNLESSMAEMRTGSQTIVKATAVLQQVSDDVKTKAASMDQDASVIVEDMVQLQARAEDTRAAMTAVGSGIREVDHAAMVLRDHTVKLDESAQQASVTLERFRVS